MDIREKVEQALREQLHPEALHVEDDNGFLGYVVSDRFRGMDHAERQALIDDLLQEPLARLDEHSARRVVALAAFTPAESAAFGPARWAR